MKKIFLFYILLFFSAFVNAQWVITDEDCNINFALDGVSVRTLPKEKTIMEVVPAGEPLNYSGIDNIFIRYEGQYVMKLPYSETVIGATSYLSAELLRQAILALLNTNSCAGGGGGGAGTVTSVGLTMPSAFSVANSPVTTTGTLAVTGAGTTAQYIRGDGSLATTPVLTNEWHINGNSGTGSASNFIGTTDAISFRIRTNNLVRVHVDSVGRVGIGTATPGSLFEVSGLLKVNLSNFGVFFGEDAGKNNSGNYNTGTGYHAVGGSGAGTSGERNCGFGFDALGRVTTGLYNTAMGVGALQFVTTASLNTAIGTSCLQNNTGDDNTAMGANAMILNTSGRQNDAHGVDCLGKNTTGSYNAAFGGGAGYPNTVGDTNTFCGADAGRYNSVGGFNVALGTNATAALIVPFDNLTGSFTVGERVNNTTTGGHAYVIKIVGSNLFMAGGSGLVNGWADNNSLTGLSSGATAQINGTPDNPDYTVAIGASPASIVGTVAACMETGEINIASTIRGRQDVTGDSTLNIVRLTGNTTITEGLSFSRTSINTTAGDGSTQNAPAGRFRKDTSGSTFTLTNSYITANSIIMITYASDPGITGFDSFVVAGTGSAVITFTTSGVAAAPVSNTDVNFLIVN